MTNMSLNTDLTVTTFADVKVGDVVICGGYYVRVDNIRTYAANEPRPGPISLVFAAVELVTVEGSRWGAPQIPTNTYHARVLES